MLALLKVATVTGITGSAPGASRPMLTRLPETWAGTLLNALTMSANPSRTKPTSGTVATVDRHRPLPLADLGTSWLAMLSFAADSDQCGQLAQHISNHRRLGAQRST